MNFLNELGLNPYAVTQAFLLENPIEPSSVNFDLDIQQSEFYQENIDIPIIERILCHYNVAGIYAIGKHSSSDEGYHLIVTQKIESYSIAIAKYFIKVIGQRLNLYQDNKLISSFNNVADLIRIGAHGFISYKRLQILEDAGFFDPIIKEEEVIKKETFLNSLAEIGGLHRKPLEIDFPMQTYVLRRTHQGQLLLSHFVLENEHQETRSQNSNTFRVYSESLDSSNLSNLDKLGKNSFGKDILPLNIFINEFQRACKSERENTIKKQLGLVSLESDSSKRQFVKMYKALQRSPVGVFFAIRVSDAPDSCKLFVQKKNSSSIFIEEYEFSHFSSYSALVESIVRNGGLFPLHQMEEFTKLGWLDLTKHPTSEQISARLKKIDGNLPNRTFGIAYSFSNQDGELCTIALYPNGSVELYHHCFSFNPFDEKIFKVHAASKSCSIPLYGFLLVEKQIQLKEETLKKYAKLNDALEKKLSCNNIQEQELSKELRLWVINFNMLMCRHNTNSKNLADSFPLFSQPFLSLLRLKESHVDLDSVLKQIAFFEKHLSSEEKLSQYLAKAAILWIIDVKEFKQVDYLIAHIIKQGSFHEKNLTAFLTLCIDAKNDAFNMPKIATEILYCHPNTELNVLMTIIKRYQFALKQYQKLPSPGSYKDQDLQKASQYLSLVQAALIKINK